jgi:NAD(P)-dependent dehydrogenase (short-subunit alcohol dehydrogenase family)
MKLKNKVAIITGGAKGMGREISLTLASEGADLVLAARGTEALEEVAQEARALGRRAEVFGTDITRADQVKAMVEHALSAFDGRLDILVNVAGIPGPVETPLWEIDPDDFKEVLEVNIVGTFLPIKFVLPTMIAQNSGRIVNIGSNAGRAGYVNRTGYSASKWALRGLTRTVAIEVGPHNITVNCVNPGAVEGPRMEMLCQRKAKQWGWTPEEVHQHYRENQILNRTTEARDTADAVLFLVADSGRNITGQDINVDAGWGV